MNDPKSGGAEVAAASIADRFSLPAAVTGVEPYGNGLINVTFLVTAGDVRYILQRINDLVFPDPERIISNLAVLQEHIASRANPELRLPALIRARDGLAFVRDADGRIWRLMAFIPNSRGLDRLDDLEQAREVGRILGCFHVLVSSLATDRLAVTLPGFHVTPSCLEHFEQVLARHSGVHPDEVNEAIVFVRARRVNVGVLEEARRQGKIPVRVIHGDPKLDNILFDRVAGRAVSLIDLDTVQPGLVHYDLGDCLRSCCNRGGESGGASFDLDLCRAILGAYADEIDGMLNKAEVELLFDAIRLIPFELGLRFLTDHLEGDWYFRVRERGQNLRKALLQFALVADIEAKEWEIRSVVHEYFRAGEDSSES